MIELHYCPYCGNPLEEEATVCPYCNANLQQKEEDVSTSKQDSPLEDTIRYPFIFALVAIGLQSIVLAIISLVMVTRMSEKNRLKRMATIFAWFALFFSIGSTIIEIVYFYSIWPQIQKYLEEIQQVINNYTNLL